MERITNIQSCGSGNVNTGNIMNSYNNTFNKTDDEDNQIKQWLSSLEPRHRHHSVQADRVKGVGGWLLEMNKFMEWSGSQGVPRKAVLFCYGDPGVGKTHLSSLVIDWLCNQVRNRDIAVAGLYCDYLAQKEQSAVNMLGAVLKQLLERDGIPEHLRQVFREEKRGFGGRALQLPELVGILRTTIALLPEVFICIDGLDECLPKNRRELLDSLRDIVEASLTTRVFLSGRPHMRDEVKKYFAETVMIAIVPTIEDIVRYLEMRLDQDPIPSAMDCGLRAEILRVIPEEISQIFLLVSLNIAAVLEEVTVHQRRKKLDEMIQGNGLRSAYLATLARIKAQKGSRSRLGMEALMWLSHSEQSLTANELCDALGVEIGSIDLNVQNIPTIETLLGCSLGLVIVEASSLRLHLVHYTLQEYLSNNADLFPSAHSMIAEVCLTYLNFKSVWGLPLTDNWTMSPTTLLQYASLFWEAHTRREITESGKKLALRLLDGFDKHISFFILSFMEEDQDFYPPGFTGLHCSAYLGLAEIVVASLGMRKWNLNATDVAGNTAISWAARKGHGAVAKILLAQKDVAPNTPDKDGRTPLSWAAGNGYEDIVKMLLQCRDVTPDSADVSRRTPLWWAVRHNRIGVVKSLLGRRDVSPSSAAMGNRLPLLWAAQSGDEGVVKILLGRGDVNPNTPDKDGRTPLSWGAGNGNAGIVKMLLEREDVAPDTMEKDGRVPLLWAAAGGYSGIVKMFLERGIAADTADKGGQTPLLWAAANGHGAIVEMLLELEDVAPNIAGKDDRTSLLWAAGNGHESVVEMLLERGGIAPNITDKDGRTPLSWAAELGKTEVVKMLLKRGDVSPDTPDRDLRAPLLWAAGSGREDIVEMLLAREDVAPDTADKDGRTPLSWAAEFRKTDVVRMLLKRKGVTPDTADNDIRTPLLWAARNGGEGIVEMLLRREDVIPDSADKDGRTPLLWGVRNSHVGIVRMLLSREDVTPNTAEKDGRTPPLWAARDGHDHDRADHGGMLDHDLIERTP